jgi:hypothetical protein
LPREAHGFSRGSSHEFRSGIQEGAALFAEGVELLRRAGPGDDRAAFERTFGRLLGHYGYLAMRYGAFAGAQAALAESSTLLEGRHDTLGLARTLCSRAQLTFWTGALEPFTRSRIPERNRQDSVPKGKQR